MKKIFLSLSAIAMLAVGTVSCGSDDSNDGGTTPPVVTPELTENFVKVGEDSFPLNYTYLGYESSNAVEGGDVFEQSLNSSDPAAKYMVYRLVSMTEDSDSAEALSIQFIATKIDLTKTGWEDGRYLLPFSSTAETFRLNAVAVVNDTQYNEGESDEVTLELGDSFSYVADKEFVDYTANGTLEGIAYNTVIKQDLDMLYYIDRAPAAKGVKVNVKGDKAVASDVKFLRK